MARIFDIVEYPDEMREELVHRIPEVGSGDFRIGSQVIVREAQAAVFFRDGKALDVFGPGRHTITTANVPLLINYLGKLFNERSPFTAEVYFVSMREFRDRKWGTPQPIPVQTPGVGLGWLLLQGFGVYSYQVKDPQQFVTQIVGTRGVYRTADIENDLRSRLLRSLTDLLGELAGKYKTIQDILGLVDELSAGVRAKASAEFEAIGLELKSFVIASLTPSKQTAEELRSRGLLDAQVYTQLQAADAMRDAAQNPGGGAGLTAGIGAGMGIGNVMAQTLQGMNQAEKQSSQGSGSTQSGAHEEEELPPVMTPAEAAEVLKVSEEDVLAAIEAGELKARKIGRAVRISREALLKFLSGE
ncbi:MAG TPA: helix-turn-helix domain-containing protein [Anaerolineae bacterium]|nr:helix-turn-helix domain-containing protein [Anaerolineae bacterium]HID83714.1 helix-turn-helix domain-containing protein [Anaerolineales bacterium]HIQ09875.1 helix-turn-helix domain-containing protein [Anaerolineaceae bacterium]